MNTNGDHYTRVISVTAQPEDAYRALTTDFGAWWTTTHGGKFAEPGDRVKFTFPPLVSNWTFEARTLVRNKQVELECVAAYHVMTEQPAAPKDEWLGTRLVFNIKPSGGKTEISLTHQGLTPGLTCYEVCRMGWDTFFVDSLAQYLTSGTGKPHGQ